MFEGNIISETPIEFNIISIKTPKKKRRIKVYLLVCLLIIVIGGGWFLVRWMQTRDIRFTGENTKSNSVQKQNDVQIIEGIYENTFAIRQKAILVKENDRAQFTVKSLDPAVIIVDNKQYTLKKGVPQQVFLPNGKIYTIVLRRTDLLQNKLQLRFDSRVSTNIIFSPGTKDTDKQSPELIKRDGVVTVLKTTTRPEPIRLIITSNGSGLYYRYETPSEHKEGILSTSITIKHNDYIDVYVSNSTLSDINVNDIKIPNFSDSLPLTFRVVWKVEGNKALLELIPTP